MSTFPKAFFFFKKIHNMSNRISLDTIIASSMRKAIYNIVVDHPFKPAVDHPLSKPLPHQLINQTQAPPWADSSFCSLAYGVLSTISNCCPLPKGKFLTAIHPFATKNTTRMLLV
ncbi:unnamed protein product [Sphagnum jensenii]|uniref:Uncharacterized protein n=1 Tax=Sphagnum jensenii TaxID=128206 RepID=A0ABP1ARL9_9BRYO